MHNRHLFIVRVVSVALILADNSNDSTNDYSIGTSFLKNVYTAFRFDPPAVGFAQLSPQARYKSDPVGWASPLTGQYMFVWVAGIASIAIMFVVSA